MISVGLENSPPLFQLTYDPACGLRSPFMAESQRSEVITEMSFSGNVWRCYLVPCQPPPGNPLCLISVRLCSAAWMEIFPWASLCRWVRRVQHSGWNDNYLRPLINTSSRAQGLNLTTAHMTPSRHHLEMYGAQGKLDWRRVWRQEEPRVLYL